MRVGNEELCKVWKPLVTLHTIGEIPVGTTGAASHRHYSDLYVKLMVAAGHHGPQDTAVVTAVARVNLHQVWS
jgi:hypothetical protein